MQTPHKLKLLALAGLMCGAVSSMAGTASYDFNTDPTGILQFFGSANWQSTGGADPTNSSGSSGFLQLTPNQNSQIGAIIFDDFDNGLVVKAFTLDCDLRIGNGTTTPADGISIDYVRASDPLIQQGNDPTQNGFWSLGPGGGQGPEEGSTTGLAICLDTYYNGGDGTGGPGDDVIGVTLRVDGTIVKNFPMPTLNGLCTDPTSVQTGPNDGSGTEAPLCWAHLHVSLDVSGVVHVVWKGTDITGTNGFQTTFAPSPGRLVMGSRTGGANEYHEVDNIAITTVAATSPTVGTVSGNPSGFTVQLNDAGATVVNTNTITVELNGNTIPVTVTYAAPVTTITYNGFPNLIPSGSTNTVTVSFKDNFGNPGGDTRTFVEQTYAVIPAADAVPAGDINLNSPGFVLHAVQTANGPGNAIAIVEEQLLGLLGSNMVDMTVFDANGNFYETNVINYDKDPANDPQQGNFGNETILPGVPGGFNPGTDNGSDNYSFEATTYLYLPAAGTYTMGVNSDDGFRVQAGVNASDRLSAITLGQFDAGRGASDTIFTFVALAPGYYPFRLIYFQGGGGASVEWFSVNADGSKVLINDRSTNTALLAYQSSSLVQPWVSSASPNKDLIMENRTVSPAADVDVTIMDGTAATVTAASVTLTINGTAVTPTVSKTGGTTSVSYTHTYPNLFASGSTNTAVLTYTAGGVTTTDTWQFVSATYSPIPVTLVSPLGSGDATKPGFVVTAYQVDNTIGNIENNTVATESELLGLFGPNIATLTGAVTNDIFDITNYINWDRTANDGTAQPAGDGNFTYANGYPDDPIPGIPGSTGSFESVAESIQTYVEFPTAGFYQLGVNSDDGFLVTITDQLPPPALTISGPTNTALGCLSMGLLQNEVTGGRAVYGSAPPTTPLTAQVVYASPGGANDPGPYPDVTGKIALYDRGGSCFGTTSTGGKAHYLQTQGAIGAIFTTPGDTSYIFYAGANRTDTTIPVLSVQDSTSANLLRSYLTNGVTVNATIAGDTHYILGGFDDGRGASDTIMSFVVPQAGVYPIQVLYKQGGGGANCEFFSVLPSGQKVLVGDTANGGLKAYRALGVTPRPTLGLTSDGVHATISFTGTLQSSTNSVTGPYTDLTSTSPLVVPLGGANNVFFRARQ